jgi:phospholipase C
MVSMLTGPVVPVFAQQAAADVRTATPIKHVIVIIGENRSFDHVFATYQPKPGETVKNLLSEGIVTVDGKPGRNFAAAAQFQAQDTATYNPTPGDKTVFPVLPPVGSGGAPSVASNTNPPPFASVAAVAATEQELAPGGGGDGLPAADFALLTTGATGLTGTEDTRVPNTATLPSGPYQLTSATLPYDSYTGSPVHRFYQMWQQTDCSVSHASLDNPSGCRNDLFPWVESTIGAGSNGDPLPANFNDLTTGEGSDSMGFFNVSQGDAPFLKSLADQYSMSDNFHQSIEGGTGANHVALGTGLAIFFTDGHGHVATPPTLDIENPNAQPGTNNWWVQDGFSGGSYSNCSDPAQPGVGPVLSYLKTLSYHPASKCAPGAYYLLNNYNPGFLGDGTVNTAPFTIPPSQVRTIGDTLNEADISWRYYGAGWDNFVANPNSDLGSVFCNICSPFLYETAIMTNAAQRNEHLKDIPDLTSDIANGTLPSVSFIKPDGLLDGHPASSKLSLFEAFTQNIIAEVQANPKLWASTAILITWDEGGGYYDSGYIQPLDFFGDGTRIPAIMVSPYSKGGHISHVYADHVSFLKFIERNWRVPAVSPVGRDNLPNPVSFERNPYVPVNSPAIGDLMDMFDFNNQPRDHADHGGQRDGHQAFNGQPSHF